MEEEVIQKKLLVKPTINEVLSMMTWPLSVTRNKKVSFAEGFMSCRYGDSPTLRTHLTKNLGEADGIKLLAYSVGRIVAYLIYESRKTIYSYAVVVPPSDTGWESMKARQVDLGDCIANIEDMISEGYKGVVYSDPCVRRKRLLGKPLGTIELWKKKAFTYDFDKKKYDFNSDWDRVVDGESCQIFWVYDVKGLHKFYDQEFPVGRRSVSNSALSNAVNALSQEEYIVFAKDSRAELKKRLDSQHKNQSAWDAKFEDSFYVVNWNVSADVVTSVKRKLMLSSV